MTNLKAEVFLHVDFDSWSSGIYTLDQAHADFPSYDHRDSSALVSQLSWYEGMSEDGVNSRAYLVKDSGGGNYLRVTHPKGCIGTNGCGMQVRWYLPRFVDTAWVRYKVRAETGFEFRAGGKLPGLCSIGCKTAGRPGEWSARAMWRYNGNLVQYVYWPDAGALGLGDPGIVQDLEWDETEHGLQERLHPNHWHTIVTQVIMNTPGQKNGHIRTWYDNRLSLDADTLLLSVDGNDKIGQFYFTSYHGGSGPEYEPSKDVYLNFDDISVSTEPLIELPTDPWIFKPLPTQTIELNGDTLLNLNFEDHAIGTMTRNQLVADLPDLNPNNNSYDESRTEIVKEAGNQFYRWNHPKDCDSDSDCGLNVKWELGQSYDTLYFSYRVRFAENFPWMGMGGLPGLCIDADCRLDYSRPGWFRSSGSIVELAEFENKSSDYSGKDERLHWDEGDIFTDTLRRALQRRFVPGKWHTIVGEFITNTPGGERGRVRRWMDNKLVMDVDTLDFGGGGWSAVYFSSMHHPWTGLGGPWENTWIDFDDFLLVHGTSFSDTLEVQTQDTITPNDSTDTTHLKDSVEKNDSLIVKDSLNADTLVLIENTDSLIKVNDSLEKIEFSIEPIDFKNNDMTSISVSDQQLNVIDLLVVPDTSLGFPPKNESRLGNGVLINYPMLLAEDSIPEDIFIHWTASFYSNIGQYVSDEHGIISCADPTIFSGDCRNFKGGLFFAWNAQAANGRRLGTGAYVSRFRIWLTSNGLVLKRKESLELWGIQRTN